MPQFTREKKQANTLASSQEAGLPFVLQWETSLTQILLPSINAG